MIGEENQLKNQESLKEEPGLEKGQATLVNESKDDASVIDPTIVKEKVTLIKKE